MNDVVEPLHGISVSYYLSLGHLLFSKVFAPPIFVKTDSATKLIIVNIHLLYLNDWKR